MSLSDWTIFSTFIIIFHLFLQFRTYKIWPDWDTANHLYFAFLLKNRINIRSSYSFGIKWILPRIYSLLKINEDERFFDHRIINTFSGILLIIQFIYLGAQNLSIYNYLWLTLTVLIINSLYINFQTSSTEFIDFPIILLTLNLANFLPSNYTLIIPILIIILISYLFKVVDILYVLPILLIHLKNIINQPILLCTLILICLTFTRLLFHFGVKQANTYSKSRRILNPKGIKYIFLNPIWISINFIITIQIVSQKDILSTSAILVAWIILLSQKVLVSYFWYPIVILNLYFWQKLDIPSFEILKYLLPFMILWLIAGLIVLCFFDKQYLEPFYRTFFLGENGFKRYREIKSQMVCVEWIKKNISKDSNIYLWGTNTALPLKANLLHIEDTFYTHNHLFFWSNIRDKEEYVYEFIKSNYPDYIIESGIINNFKFPEDKFKNQYEKIYGSDNIKIYKLI